MSYWRIGVVLVLIGMPLLVFAGLGSYFLMINGWSFIAWWPMFGCMVLGWLLAWYWQYKKQLLRPVDLEVPIHWTQRDHEAWKLVEARAKDGEGMTPKKLGELQTYVDVGQTLAQELAQFYHPGAKDPVGSLTVPEVLSVIELASHDLAKMVERIVPAGHILTIDNWKQAQQLTKWYERFNNVYWAVSAIFNPIGTGIRYAASQAGISQPMSMLQQNLLQWFFAAYVQHIGRYLIDLNSGRLRIGATRYRQLLDEAERAKEQQQQTMEKVIGVSTGNGQSDQDPADQIKQMTVVLMGQAKAGKSSLLNALIGEERARTASTPVVNGVQRFDLLTPEVPTKLVLFDTPGYANEGPKGDLLEATLEAARGADLLFLVLHARNPGRQPDLLALERLGEYFNKRPELKPPLIVAVVTHVDLLSPAMEWKPPYDWKHPTRPKEHNIREALAVVKEQLADRIVAAVPVCTAPGKAWGVDEELLPTLACWLDEARGVAIMRVIKSEADRDRIRKVLGQLMSAGKEAAQAAWKALAK